MPGKNVCQEINFSDLIFKHYQLLIGELRTAWGQRGVRQNRLAARAGVNKTSLNKFINHGIVPSFEIMYCLLYAHLDRPPITLNQSPDPSKDILIKIKEMLDDSHLKK